MNYSKKTGLLILITTGLRMVVAGSLELGNDEVYYQAYALHLQWNYFDHPPLVALLIRLSTCNLFFQHEFFIRLGPLICAAAGTWLIYKTGTLLRNQRTGWIAAILYNTSFYTSVIAGTFILPDAPHVLFWITSMYVMIRILQKKQNEKPTALSFVLLGICTGLCIMGKVQGVFLWLGFGGYILFHRRDLLKYPGLWLSAALCLAVIFPIFWWNVENHFITYHYHGARIGFWGKADLDHLLQQVLGSVFYNNPVNIILYIFCGVALVQLKYHRLPESTPLLLWLSLPLIGVLLWLSIFSETLPHWSGPAYLSLMLLAALCLDEQLNAGKTAGWLKASAWVYMSVLILGLLCIRYLPFRIGSQQEQKLGMG
ncbi:MAG TPA: glycosyltransferase family 39 protein, partial [Puia sp.]